MSGKILQINYRFNVSPGVHGETVSTVAEPIAAAPGLRWKIWLVNADEQTAGGIYLFDDEDAVETFLASDLVGNVLAHPALSDFEVKQFDVNEELTAITRGPLSVHAAG